MWMNKFSLDLFRLKSALKSYCDEAGQQLFGCHIYKGSKAIMQELNKLNCKNNSRLLVLYLLKPIVDHQTRKHSHTKPVIV